MTFHLISHNFTFLCHNYDFFGASILKGIWTFKKKESFGFFIYILLIFYADAPIILEWWIISKYSYSQVNLPVFPISQKHNWAMSVFFFPQYCAALNKSNFKKKGRFVDVSEQKCVWASYSTLTQAQTTQTFTAPASWLQNTETTVALTPNSSPAGHGGPGWWMRCWWEDQVCFRGFREEIKSVTRERERGRGSRRLKKENKALWNLILTSSPLKTEVLEAICYCEEYKTSGDLI